MVKAAAERNALSGAERDELQRLRRENRQLKLERDILSKATAWFAHKSEKASLSRRGNCQKIQKKHNAPMESVWASLKKEQVHHQHYRPRTEARADIFDYIEAFYNTLRRRIARGNQSPLAFTQSFVSD